jgi:hypothetical protein
VSQKDAEVHNLGRRVAKYTSRFSGLGLFNVVFAAVCLVGGIIGVGAAVVWLFDMIREDPDSIHAPIIGLCFAGFFAFIGIDQLRKAIRNAEVTLYEGGFVYQAFLDTIVVPWGQIAAVWRFGVRKGGNVTRLIYTIQLRDKTRIKLDSDSLKDLEGLGNVIQQAVARVMLPRCAKKLNAGGVVNFGKLNLSQRGISDGKQEIPWADIREVRVNAGYIRIRRADKWLA